MIEVPPPQSFDGRTLRYGAMTCGQYIWMRSKWAFASCVATLGIAIWEFSIPAIFTRVMGVVLVLSIVLNIWVASRWRHSWRYWHMRLGYWLVREELRPSYQD